jgi:hypothetical protein
VRPCARLCLAGGPAAAARDISWLLALFKARALAAVYDSGKRLEVRCLAFMQLLESRRRALPPFSRCGARPGVWLLFPLCPTLFLCVVSPCAAPLPLIAWQAMQAAPGMTPAKAWNSCALSLAETARSHCYLFMLRNFSDSIAT